MTAAQGMRRITVTERDGLIPIAIVLSLNFVLLLCWTLIDPMMWQREFINEDPTNSYGFCESEGNAHHGFVTCLILLNGAAIGLALERAWRARNMGDDSYTESRWVGVACLSWLQVLILGIPVLLLTRYQPVASYFVQVAIVFLVCVSMLLFMFLPKIRLMKKPSEEELSVQRRVTGYQPSQPSSGALDPQATENILRKRIIELEKSLKESIHTSAPDSLRTTTPSATANTRSLSFADGGSEFERKSVLFGDATTATSGADNINSFGADGSTLERKKVSFGDTTSTTGAADHRCSFDADGECESVSFKDTSIKAKELHEDEQQA